MKNEIETGKAAAVAVLAVVSLLGWFGLASAQTFNSGSTGADGAFNPVSHVTLNLPPDGVFHYTTVTIPAGVWVSFNRNAANTPVTMLATGDVVINGVINLNGAIGNESGSGAFARPGGLGGPGGFNGGNGGYRDGLLGTAGQGPGGGAAGNLSTNAGPGGGAYGAPAAFTALIPLFGGSGGGGGSSPSGGFFQNASAGSGGGGAILIASSTKITVAGTIQANGGDRNCQSVDGGNAGSGGAVRLVAAQLAGAGSITVAGGSVGTCPPNATNGRVRLEAFTQGFTGSVTQGVSVSVSPGTVGAVNAASTPQLINVPTLAITSVDSVAVSATPTASFATADVNLAAGTPNPATVTIAATNTPVGAPTAFSLKLISQTAPATTIAIPAANHSGTFASSTATTPVTFPAGQVSVIQAWATMTLTGQIASLFPLIDGEPVESVAVASPLGDGKPVLNLVTKSGKEKRFDELAPADQSKVIVAWQALAANR